MLKECPETLVNKTVKINYKKANVSHLTPHIQFQHERIESHTFLIGLIT